MSNKRVAVLVGSLRQQSLNRKLAKTISELAPKRFSFIFPSVDLPLFNEDLESNPPAAWVSFRNELRNANALLIATPEYNRGTTGVLKNALDVASRPYGQNVLAGLPTAVVSASIGQLGGALANHQVRQSLVFLDAPTLQQPEVYLSNATGLFDASGKLQNEQTKAFLQKFTDAFVKFVDRY